MRDLKYAPRQKIHVTFQFIQRGDGQDSPHLALTNRNRMGRPENFITEQVPVRDSVPAP